MTIKLLPFLLTASFLACHAQAQDIILSCKVWPAQVRNVDPADYLDFQIKMSRNTVWVHKIEIPLVTEDGRYTWTFRFRDYNPNGPNLTMFAFLDRFTGDYLEIMRLEKEDKPMTKGKCARLEKAF